MTALEIEIFDGQKSIARGVFDQTKIIIGRISSADFRVSDQRVSRIHALLERLEDGSLRLTDLASTHGTFVNGERIVERILGAKDEIKISDLRAKLTYVTVEPTAPGAAFEVTSTPGHAALSSRPPPPSRVASGPAISLGGAGASVPVRDLGGAASADKSSPAVTGPREPTQIRSLKDTARTRGVLDPGGMAEDLEVTVYWEDHILNIDHYRNSNATISIGSDIKNTYLIPSTQVPPRYDFIRLRGATAELNLHPSMKGSARVQGKMETFDDLRKQGRSQLVISGQDIAKVQVGTVNFFLMFVPEPNAIPRAPIFDQGRLFWMMQVSVAFAAVLFLTLATIFRDPIQGVVKEFPEKYRKIIVEEFKKRQEVVQKKIEEKKPVELPKVEAKQVGKKAVEAVKNENAVMKEKTGKSGGNEGEGARERGAEGKRGRPNAKHETGITNRPKIDPNRRNQVKDAPVKGQTDSILGALQNTGLGTKLAKMSGKSNNGDAGASGNDPLDTPLAGVGGGGIRNGRGSGGSGLQGTGTGGGGTAVGVGGLGTKGFGGGASGDGVGSIPGKGDFAVGTEGSGVRVVGSLSREEIERVVRAHQNEVTSCYQRELQRNPKLFGKLAVKWTIVDGGRVSVVSSIDNQTGSSNLDDCIRTRIRDWAFPSPTGGSQAVVEWAWNFKPPGT